MELVLIRGPTAYIFSCMLYQADLSWLSTSTNAIITLLQPVHTGAWDQTGSNWFDFVCSVNANHPAPVRSELGHRKLSNWIDPRVVLRPV